MQAGVGAIRLSTPKHIASGVGARELADTAVCTDMHVSSSSWQDPPDLEDCVHEKGMVEMLIPSMSLLFLSLFFLECLMPSMSLSLESLNLMSGGGSDAELGTRCTWRGDQLCDA